MNAEVAPAASAAGVHVDSVPVDLPFLSGGELSFAQLTDGLSAADTGVANGNVSASPTAATSPIERIRTDNVMSISPLAERACNGR